MLITTIHNLFSGHWGWFMPLCLPHFRDFNWNKKVDLSKRWFEQYSDQQIYGRFNKTWKLTRLTQILIEPHKTDLGRKAFYVCFSFHHAFVGFYILSISQWICFISFYPSQKFLVLDIPQFSHGNGSYPGHTHSSPLSSSRSHASMPAERLMLRWFWLGQALK